MYNVQKMLARVSPAYPIAADTTSKVLWSRNRDALLLDSMLRLSPLSLSKWIERWQSVKPCCSLQALPVPGNKHGTVLRTATAETIGLPEYWLYQSGMSKSYVEYDQSDGDLPQGAEGSTHGHGAEPGLALQGTDKHCSCR